MKAQLLAFAVVCALWAGFLFVALPARSSWGRSCFIHSDVHVITISAGCKAKRVIVPRRMHVQYR